LGFTNTAASLGMAFSQSAAARPSPRMVSSVPSAKVFTYTLGVRALLLAVDGNSLDGGKFVPDAVCVQPAVAWGAQAVRSDGIGLP